MKKINEYTGPYHWYQSRFQLRRYVQAFYLAIPYLNKTKTVLDFGCGDGRMTALIAPHSKKVVGIDNQERPIAFARLMVNEKNVEFHSVELESLPKQNFDVMICFDVIEHIPRRNAAEHLNQLRNLLTSNGVLLITTPNRKEFWGRIFGHKTDEKHYYEYSLEELENMLQSAGFKIKEKHGIHLNLIPAESLLCLPGLFIIGTILIRLGYNLPSISKTLFISATRG